MPLADLGRRAWPRDPAQVCQEDFEPIAVHGLMVELGWRTVDIVAAQVQGKAAFQASAPPLAGWESPSACPRPSLLVAFARAVYKATCPPPHAKS